MNRFRIILLSALIISLLLGLLPTSGAQAQAAIAHPFDNSLLLMISSQMRLEGEVQSALIPAGHKLALSRQAANGIEIDVLLQLYADQIARLRASDDYDPDLEAKLINLLESKVDALHQQAQELDASRSRRRGGLFGFFGRAAKSLGRATGWLMGKAMDGAGEIAEFAIEDVAPQVLKEALQNGAPLNAALVRRVARELLKRRVHTLFEREVEKLAERISRRQEAAYDDGAPTVDPTWEADFMEAFEEGDQNQPDPPAGPSGSSSGGSSGSNPGVVVYDFTASNMYNFTESWIGVLLLDGYTTGDGYSCNSARPWLDGAVLHLAFDRSAMTVSGWLEGNAQEVRNAKDDIDLYNLTGSFRVTFSDLPVIPTNDSKIAFMFEGYGDGTATINGSVLCQKNIDDTGEWLHYIAAVQKSNNNPVPIIVKLYHPGTIIGDHAQSMIVLSGGAVNESIEPQDGFSYEFYYRFDQPFEELVP